MTEIEAAPAPAAPAPAAPPAAHRGDPIRDVARVIVGVAGDILLPGLIGKILGKVFGIKTQKVINSAIGRIGKAEVTVQKFIAKWPASRLQRVAEELKKDMEDGSYTAEEHARVTAILKGQA